MSEKYFPANTCVLACSGPSLNTVDPFILGLPVVAVSTAIRKINTPHFWVIADYLNEMHGDEGRAAYANPDVIKVVPEGKISTGANAQSVVACQYDTSTRWPDLEASLFIGRQPFIRGPHKSVTFGLQWLHFIGVRNIIWVGNDLKANSMKEKYAYEVKDFDMKKAYNYDKTLDQTADALRNWYPIALKRGFKWFSWNCGSVFESIVPKFDLNWWESEGKEQLKEYAPITFPTIEVHEPKPQPYVHTIQIKDDRVFKKVQTQSEKYESIKEPVKVEEQPKKINLSELSNNNYPLPPAKITERREMRKKIIDVKTQLRNNSNRKR